VPQVLHWKTDNVGVFFQTSLKLGPHMRCSAPSRQCPAAWLDSREQDASAPLPKFVIHRSNP